MFSRWPQWVHLVLPGATRATSLGHDLGQEQSRIEQKNSIVAPKEKSGIQVKSATSVDPRVFILTESIHSMKADTRVKTVGFWG